MAIFSRKPFQVGPPRVAMAKIVSSSEVMKWSALFNAYSSPGCGPLTVATILPVAISQTENAALSFAAPGGGNTNLDEFSTNASEPSNVGPPPSRLIRFTNCPERSHMDNTLPYSLATATCDPSSDP